MRAPLTPSTAATTRTNMTPMIDVVFLLIIFFLVSSHLARQETRPRVALTRAATSQPSDPAAAPINLTIDAQGHLRLGGRQLSLDRLAGHLEARLRRGGPATGRESTSPVRLRVDRSVPYDTVEPVLRRLTQMGIDNVSMATLDVITP